MLLTDAAAELLLLQLTASAALAGCSVTVRLTVSPTLAVIERCLISMPVVWYRRLLIALRRLDSAILTLSWSYLSGAARIFAALSYACESAAVSKYSVLHFDLGGTLSYSACRLVVFAAYAVITAENDAGANGIADSSISTHKSIASVRFFFIMKIPRF